MNFVFVFRAFAVLKERGFQTLLKELCQNSMENLCLLSADHRLRKVSQKKRQLNDFVIILDDICRLSFSRCFFNILLFCFLLVYRKAFVVQRFKVLNYFFD